MLCTYVCYTNILYLSNVCHFQKGYNSQWSGPLWRVSWPQCFSFLCSVRSSLKPWSDTYLDRVIKSTRHRSENQSMQSSGPSTCYSSCVSRLLITGKPSYVLCIPSLHVLPYFVRDFVNRQWHEGDSVFTTHHCVPIGSSITHCYHVLTTHHCVPIGISISDCYHLSAAVLVF